MPELPKVVILMGPTGAGKSALALSLAQKFNGEIVNADSRQIYAGMDIGTDKIGSRHPTSPSGLRGARRGVGSWDDPVVVKGVPHYLLDIRTPDASYSAAEFRDDARKVIQDIHQRGKLPIVVGGTGFYIRVLTGDRPLPDVPPDPAFRAWATSQPVERLARELQERAPDLYARVDNLANRRRVTRYLEIARGPGRKWRKTPTHYSPLVPRSSSGVGLPTPWNILKLALLPPSDILRARIAERVDTMFQRGFMDEVRRLADQYGEDAPGLQAVGYRQVLPHLRRETDLETTRRAVLRAHLDYARRQRAWLKKEPGLVRAVDATEAERYISRFLT